MTGNRVPKGLLVAAPASGSGKTVLTLALLRALKNAGCSITGAKAGPDYIDPAFHALAAGRDAFNLDPWAMNNEHLYALASTSNGEMLLIEGMMGLFDGAADGTGSAAELASKLGLPVLFVVDAAKQSHSIAALVRGFSNHSPDVTIAGVLLNKVGSERHEKLLREALAPIGISVPGAVHRDDALHMPERHLGLVQAGETGEVERFIEAAARLVSNQCDLEAIAGLFSEMAPAARVPDETPTGAMPVLGQHIAIARDEAFSFLYPHLLSGWRESGAELSFFSPLNDEGPSSSADAVYLPGGYPELHCGKLAAAQKFRQGMMDAKRRDALIYGECGGYMVLGKGITDRGGAHHAMLDLLELETSFEKRKLHLGYRKISGINGYFNGMNFSGHEFHYTTALREEGAPLFVADDALGVSLGNSGLCSGRVMGSYLHVIARAASRTDGSELI